MMINKESIRKLLKSIESSEDLEQEVSKILFPFNDQTITDTSTITLIGKCAWELGMQCLREKSIERAILYLNLSLDMAIALDKEEEQITILCEIGYAYYSLKNYQESIKVWEEALEKVKQFEKYEHLGQVAVYLGAVWGELSQFEKAAKFDKIAFEHHLKNYETAPNKKEKNILAKSIGYDSSFLGLDYSYIGPLEKAECYFNQSLEFFKTINDYKEIVNCQGNLARIYALSGQKENALKYYFLAKETLDKVKGSPQNQNILIDKGIGNIYRDMGIPEKALIYYKNALETARLVKDKKTENRLLNCIGIIHRDSQELDQAFSNYIKSQQIAKECGDQIGLSDVLGSIGNLFYQNHQAEKAEPYYQKALEISDNHGDIAFVSKWTGNLGNVYYSLGKTDKAISFYKKALNKLKGFHDKDHEYLWNYNLGSLYKNGKKDLTTAYNYYLKAIICLQELRREIRCDDFSRNFGETKVFVYQDMVDVCLQLQDRKLEAIEFIEQGKGYTITRMIAEANLEPASNVPKELIKKYKNLLAEQRRIEKKISSSFLKDENDFPECKNRAQINTTEQKVNIGKEADLKKLIDVRKSQDQNLKEIAKHDPIFYNILNPQITELSEIQNHLQQYDSDTVLIEFFVTNNQLNVFIISKEKYHILEIPELNEDELLHLLNTQWFDPYKDFRMSLNKTLEMQWPKSIFEISQKLSEKIWNRIQWVLNKLDIKSLILIPHSGLHLLPLHLIQVKTPGSEEKKYLLDKYEISYAPNFQILRHCVKNNGRKNLTDFFAVSNPDLSLPWADIEVHQISKLFKKTKILSHSEATKSAICTHIGNTEIIHFATHSENVSYAGNLKFDSMVKSSLKIWGKENADSIPLQEIFTDYRIPNSSIVVLSACETGMIQLDKGDEYIGFPSAFLYAGAPAVLSTLWQVDDVSTSLLIQRWYKNVFDKNMNRAKALKIAQQWLRTLKAQKLIQQLEMLIVDLENLLSLARNEKAKASIEAQLDDCKNLVEFYCREESDSCPFEHPYYWGAFYLTGNPQ